MNRKRFLPVCLFAIVLAVAFDACALTTYSITKTGRRVQLDGFLLEWIKDSAKTLGTDTRWTWDALNTKEGLTGYFKAPASAGSDWSFAFLPQRLSTYSKMNLRFSPDSAKSFFRVSLPGASLDSSMVAEWVIPWRNIAIDSLTGDYKVGVMAFDGRGDTLPPVVFTGRAFREKTQAPWGKVYSKAVVLLILLIALFYVQKKVKKKSTLKRKNQKSKV